MLISKDWAMKAIDDILRGTDGVDLRVICNDDEIKILREAREIVIKKEAQIRDRPNFFESDSV